MCQFSFLKQSIWVDITHINRSFGGPLLITKREYKGVLRLEMLRTAKLEVANFPPEAAEVTKEYIPFLGSKPQFLTCRRLVSPAFWGLYCMR